MKRKIFIIEEYAEEKQDILKKLIVNLVKEEETDLVIRLRYFHTPMTRKKLDSLADIIKSIGKEYEFVVDIILETDQWKNIKRYKNTLNQYAIGVELQVSDNALTKEVLKYKKKFLLQKITLACASYDGFDHLYQNWKQVELPIRISGYTLTNLEFMRCFEAWIEDAKAVWLEPIEDYINAMMLGITPNNCEHSSCMGRYLYLDRYNAVYFCAKKKDGTKMYSAQADTEDVLYNEVYSKVLGIAIEKRKQCIERCEFFELCRGGCPLRGQKEQECMEFMQQAARIGQFIEKDISNSFVDIANPCMRQLCLRLIAYGFQFENE